MTTRVRPYLAVPGLVGVAVLLALAGTSCRSHRLPKDAARLTVDGRAAVARGSGAFSVVHGTRVLRAGDRVRMDAGTARLELGRGGRMELRQGTELDFADPVVLRAGDLLVQPDKSPLGVASDDADVQVENGAAQVARTLALTVSSYRGTVVVGSPGAQDLRIRAPRQASVPARGVVPTEAQPLRCGADDPWQQRFLATPCDIGDQLEAAGSGMAAQLPAGEGHTPGFFRLLVPALEKMPEVDSALDLDRAPGDNLLASVIAVHARTGTFTSRVHDMYRFRDQGEDNWGLVALDQGVADADPLNGDLEAAIGRAPKRFEAAFAVASTTGGPLGPGAVGASGGPGADGTGGTNTTGPDGGSGGPGGSGTGPGTGGPPTTIPGGPVPPPPGGTVPTTPTTLPSVPGVPTSLLPVPLPLPLPGTAPTTTTTIAPGGSPSSGPLPVPLPTTTTTISSPLSPILDPILDPLGSTATTTTTTSTTVPSLPPVTTPPLTTPTTLTALTTVTTTLSTVTTVVGGLLPH